VPDIPSVRKIAFLPPTGELILQNVVVERSNEYRIAITATGQIESSHDPLIAILALDLIYRVTFGSSLPSDVGDVIWDELDNVPAVGPLFGLGQCVLDAAEFDYKHPFDGLTNGVSCVAQNAAAILADDGLVGILTKHGLDLGKLIGIKASFGTLVRIYKVLEFEVNYIVLTAVYPFDTIVISSTVPGLKPTTLMF
jgi:hypothetical protein